MLQFSRGVHTRSKKVSVQLLRDFRHVGQRGEVVQVTEGLMRNKLHPQNGAVYMVAGPQIPVVKKVYREKKAAAQLEKPEKKTILDSLVFDVPEGVTPVGAEGASQGAAQQGAQGSAVAAQGSTAQGSTQKGTTFAWQNQFVEKTN